MRNTFVLAAAFWGALVVTLSVSAQETRQYPDKQAEPKRAASDIEFQNQKKKAADAAKKKMQEQSPNQFDPAKIQGIIEKSGQTASAAQALELVAQLTRQIQRCWIVQAGAARVPVVRLQFELDRTGRIVGEPRVVNPSPGVDFEMAANNAIRATKQCQPYALPQDKFEVWQAVELAFDASGLLAP